MLKKLRILQIGDIHLTSNSKTTTSIDDKDERFPASLKSVVSQNKLKNVFLELYSIIETGDCLSVQLQQKGCFSCINIKIKTFDYFFDTIIAQSTVNKHH